ncbi:MAG: hypothetical protein ACK55I_28150, partial [bacterium]
SIRQEIGLGDAAGIEKIEIQWPKPGVPNSVYANVQMDSFVKMTEGNPQPEQIGLKAFALRR